MSDRKSARAFPRGECWCGCGEPVPAQSFFVSGHDRRAEAMFIRMEYGSVAQMLAEHDYGPGARNLQVELERRGRRSDARG